MAVQPDGKILLNGNFSFVSGRLQVGIARLNSDGSLDTNFVGGLSGIPNSTADYEVALQTDGKILLAGRISKLDGTTRNRIGRLNPDGSLDGAFDPGAGPEIYAMTPQPDGRILLVGSFTNLANQLCNGIGRLNNDGTFDTNFTASTDGAIHAVALQPDGKILVGGSFTNLDGQSRTNLGRLNPDGSLDLSFDAGADNTVTAIAVLANGSIAIAGDFTSLAGLACSHLGRVDTNGALDAAFHPAPDGPVETLAVDVNGGIVLGGTFTTVGGQSRTNIARLNADGSADLTFNPGANNTVLSVAVQPDGKVIAAGLFSMLNGQARASIGRLNGNGSATNTLTFDSNTITWQRSGAGPEVWNTIFEYTTNGTDWAQVPGTRIAGGWQAGGLALPGNATVRARGFVAGSSESSSWFVENGAGPAAIVSQPTSITNNPFTLAQFAVNAAGQPPLSYQWLKNGTPLDDSNNIFGANSPLLNVSNVLGGDAAPYQVVVSNASGSVTSAVASLTVLDPLITVQPTSHTNDAGQTVTFTANASGTTNFTFQWFKDGAQLADGGNIIGAQTSALTLTNVLGGDAGEYRVVVTNVWGSATSAVASLSVVDPLLVTNPVGQFVNRGQPATFGVLVRGEDPLHYQWRKDGVELPGEVLASLTLTNVQGSDAAGYDVIVTNAFGSVTSTVATLEVNSALADSLAPTLGNGNYVWATAIQADGKILLGGDFTTIDGQSCLRLARLYPDGSWDSAFNPGADKPVRSFAVQTDGAILVGGDFTSFGGQARTCLARVSATGALDAGFNPSITGQVPPSVYTIFLQRDGGILLGGSFTALAGQSHIGIGRLHPNGSVDANFLASTDGSVFAIAIQPDGKILIGGHFTTVNGEPHSHIARLEADGRLDTNFNASANFTVLTLAQQADGRIVVGGAFATLNGQPRICLGRLYPDGTLDTGFHPDATNSSSPDVYSMAIQTDGQIVVGGRFSSLGGLARNSIGRLTPAGDVDTTFNPNPNGALLAVAVQPDGKILAAGTFGTLAGQPRAYFGRLEDAPTQAVIDTVQFDDSSVDWQRSGPGPEIWRADFAFSTNGLNWTDLGDGWRVAGGWQATNLPSLSGGVVRARGFVDDASWYFDEFGGLPLFTQSPVSRTNNATTTATFTVAALGSAPIHYQWLKNGTNLTDGGSILGAGTGTLMLTNVLGADAGAYSVVLSNTVGVVTSAVATLTVIDPLLTGQPAGQYINLGQSASFSVTVLGTEPLSYQWRQDGVALAGATLPMLTLTNLQATNAGNYDVVVGNVFGSVTSAVATLTLNLVVPDSFNPGANGPVNSLALQPDGQILVGGAFTSLGGQPRYRLGRLNPDGTLDTTFDPSGGPNDTNAYYNVSGMVLQPDAKIVVAGVRGGRQTEATSVWRIDDAGNDDTNFVTPLTSTVNALALAPDGSILAGGSFLVGKPGVTTNLARLFPDGTLDSNFVASVSGTVNTIALQPDGKLLVGGSFTALDGINLHFIARLNTNGTPDTNFNPNANSPVNALAVQPDGKILVGGLFTTIDGTNRNRIARLNPDGTLDTDFNPSANNIVSTLALQTDGNILLGGAFTTIGRLTRNRIARVNPDGSVDATFNPGANNAINALAIQPDGNILVGGGTYAGGLSILGGQSCTNIGRLLNSAPTAQSLDFDGSSVTWLRGGTSPEVWRTTFEVSTNERDWMSLGAGERVAGGWQLTGVSIPSRAMVRARGFVTDGLFNGSGWFAQSISPSVIAPEILVNDGGLGFHPDLFGFNVLAVAGQVVVIEATTDFISWTPLQTNVVTDLGQFMFADAHSGQFPHRFYRARLFDGTLPPPSILNASGSFGVADGFSFDLTGVAGQTLNIEASTNLTDWIVLTTNVLEENLLHFTDGDATHFQRRFYRLRVKQD